jgi:hypothetical protein
MKRRRALQVISISIGVVAAGCQSDSESPPESPPTSTPTATSSPSPSPSDPPSPSPSATSSPPSGEEACPSPPGTEVDPATLLPAPPRGWEQVETNAEAAGLVGAEVGFSGVYSSPDTGEYTVEIVRWPSLEEAEDGLKLYRGSESDFQLRARLGRFTFAVAGAALPPARTLLIATPALTAECVDEVGRTGV